jgi:hypothetical protein
MPVARRSPSNASVPPTPTSRNWPCPPLPGLRVTPTEYPDKTGRTLPGLALAVTDPAQFRPAAAAHTLITALERQLGDTLWNHPGARPHFYTQLWGTPTPAPPWPLFSTPHMLY